MTDPLAHIQLACGSLHVSHWQLRDTLMLEVSVWVQNKHFIALPSLKTMPAAPASGKSPVHAEQESIAVYRCKATSWGPSIKIRPKNQKMVELVKNIVFLGILCGCQSLGQTTCYQTPDHA
ncbi:MAG: hypothetical protein ACK6D6_15110 [Planctomyces sp.]